MSLLNKLTEAKYHSPEDLEEESKVLEVERLVYSKLIKKADSLFKKIGQGSSRKVYEYKDDYVLKVALNAKGIDQNEFEAELGQTSYYSSFLAICYYASSDYRFLISEKATPINVAEFEKFTGVTFQEYCDYIEKWCLSNSRKTARYRNYRPPQKIADILNAGDSFLNDIEQLIANYGLVEVWGDFTRISHYGKVTRPDGEFLVLIDYGLNEATWNEHYDKSKSRF